MKKMEFSYDKKYISELFYDLLMFIIINVIAVFTFLKNTPELLKIDLFFLFFVVLDLISFGLSLFSDKPYVEITDKSIFIDRKGRVFWKDIDCFRYSKAISWLQFSGKKCKYFYGIKTDFLFNDESEKLMKIIEEKIKEKK